MIDQEDQLPDVPADETVTEPTQEEASPYAPDPLPAAPTQAVAQPAAPVSDNPFAEFNTSKDDEPNPFSQFNTSKDDDESSASGSFVRGLEKGIVPTATALPAIGFGATLGAELGAAAGPLGSAAGGFIGGLAGGAAGGMFGSAVQDFALSYVPDDLKKRMGLDEDQAIIDEARHPYASQIGGLVPFLVTARPWAAPGTAPMAATISKRVGSDLLQRGFSGTVMGGWEFGNEAYHGNVDWNKVAIATAFGTMFPHQNKYGTAVIETGSNAARYTLGKARDLGIFGPGHNEDTFQGDAETNDVAAQASHQYARDEEAEMQGPRLPGPEMVTETARRMEPELFDEYDRLTAIKDEARAAIDEINAGSPKRVSELSNELVQAQRAYTEYVNGRNGYEGGREARVMRQNIRTIQNEIETLSNRPMEHAETEGADNDLTARHRQDLIKADEALRDLAPKLTEAKRRAAIGLNRGDFVIEPKAEKPPAEGEQQAPAAPDYTADRKAIIKEAKRQMIEAGRPEEEAKAYGELTASRYVSRASRFDGKLGTPLELYMSEGAKVRSWEPAKRPQATPEPAKKVEPGKLPEAPAAEKPVEVTGEVSFAPEAGAQPATEAAPAPVAEPPAPEPAGPKAGDTITLNATRYKIEAIDDNSVKLVAARKKDNALPLNLKRNVFDQMVGEHVAPAAKVEGEKITLNGEPIDAKLAEVVRSLMAKQEAATKETVPGRLPDSPDTAALRAKMRDEALSDEYPVSEPANVIPFERRPDSQDNEPEMFTPQSRRVLPEQLKNEVTALSDEQLNEAFKAEQAAYAERIKDIPDTVDQLPPLTDRHLALSLERGRRLHEQIDREERAKSEGVTAAADEPYDVWKDVPDDQLDYSVLSGRQYVPQEPQTLLGFIKMLGGVQDVGGTLKSQDISRVLPGLMNKKGMPADKAREAAVEQGYLPEDSTPDDLLNALMSGEPVYRAADRAEAQQYHRHQETLRQANRYKSTVDHLNAEYPGNHPDIIADAAMRITYDGLSTEEAFDLAATNVAIEVPEWVKAVDVDNIGEAFDAWVSNTSPKTEGHRRAQEGGGGAAGRPEGESGAGGVSGGGSSEGSVSYEAGAEGKPQAVIPGAEQISQKKLAERLAGKPMRGGNEPAGGMFDEGKTNQSDLFQTRQNNAERIAGYNTKTREIWLGKNSDPSSIIHESGHQYLEELKRDALHGEAPEQVKADLETVKDWVGWKRGQQDFTRKQHERFAKGFERYIYDGVAPSKELAGVFERFTNWLREVYQSIRGLKKNGIPELTPEIRAVFDRMLADEPRRTVVAGEIKSGRSLGATHEAEAVKITHREAAAVADRAAGERATYVKELPSEVKNELAAAAERNGRSVRELGASADGSGGMAEDRGGQGTRAGSGAGGADRGAQRGGGSENAAESAGASAGADGNGYVPRERASFASKEGKFVDKAGNIRLENITNEEDLREAAREVAAQNDGFIGDRRGVVTDGQVHDLATAIGDEGAWRMVEKWAKGSAYNAEEIMAMRQLFQKQLARVVELAKAAKAAGESDWQAMRDYAVERDRLVNIQKTVSGATAEWGRAGRSFRDISGSKDYRTVNKLFQENTGRTLFQTRVELDLLSKLDDPEAAANFLRNSDRPGFHRYILEYWINNLISGPVTHATYMVGNDLLALYRAIPETLARAAVSRAMKAAGRNTETADMVHFGEVMAQVKGFGEGFAPALKAAAGSFRTGVTTLLPGETMRNLPGLMPGQQYAKPDRMDPTYKLSQVMPDMFGAIRGMKDAVIAFGQMLDKGVDGAPLWSLHTSPLGVIPDIAYKGVPAIPIGSAIRVPGRFIQAIHAFHRVNFYAMELNAEAYRKAAAEGLTGEEFAQRVAELKKNPDLEMIKRSADAATEGTMMGQGGEFTRNLARLTNTKILGVPWLKFIDPFVHITGNVIEQSLGQRTPLALFSPEMRADLTGKNGAYAQDKAVGRIMLGTALSAAVAGYVMDGMITGGGPKDREEKGNWERMGIQPYSVKIGDTWYSYHRLGALGLLIGVAADMYKVAKHATQEEMAEAGAALLEAFSHNILEESFMRGPSELFRAIENPKQYGASWARNFLSSFAPASVGMSQITRATDPYSRQARTIADAFMGKYPWWSEGLQPRRDLWGDPIVSKQLTMGTAIYQSPESRDPVNQEMYRLNVRKAPVDKKIRNIELSPEQYDDYARIAGRLTKMQLEQIMNSPDYQSMPDFQKMDVIEKVFQVTRKAARETMLQKYPQLIHDAITLKMNRYSDEGLERQ